MVPMILLSGLIFPIENMPPGDPGDHLRDPPALLRRIIRGVFLSGSGLGVLWPQAVAMVAIGLAIMTIASLRFRKRLD